MTLAFEHNRTDWEIRISMLELLRVHMMLMSVDRDPSNKSVVWLVKMSPTKRAWVASSNFVTTWITADCHPKDPGFALPIPDQFVSSLIDLAHGENAVDIFCNEHEGVIIGRSNDRYAVVDHPEDVEFTLQNLPYRAQPYGSHDEAAMAIVDAVDLQLFADLVLNWHWKQKVSDNIWPFVSIEIGNNQFAWTSDWRRHGMFRTSGGVPAITKGSISTQFFPYAVARLMKAHEYEGDVKVFIGGEHADYVYFAGDDWGVRVVNDTEVNARWYYKLGRALKRAELDVQSRTSDRMPDFIPFSIEGIDCYASIHTREDELSEFARLTHVAATNVYVSLKLYEEINALNASLTGASVILRDDEIRVVCDFPLTDELDLAKTMAAFLIAIEQIGQAYEILPLFSGAGEGYDF
jgi:hypothetical protein